MVNNWVLHGQLNFMSASVYPHRCSDDYMRVWDDCRNHYGPTLSAAYPLLAFSWWSASWLRASSVSASACIAIRSKSLVSHVSLRGYPNPRLYSSLKIFQHSHSFTCGLAPLSFSCGSYLSRYSKCIREMRRASSRYFFFLLSDREWWLLLCGEESMCARTWFFNSSEMACGRVVCLPRRSEVNRTPDWFFFYQVLYPPLPIACKSQNVFLHTCIKVPSIKRAW